MDSRARIGRGGLLVGREGGALVGRLQVDAERRHAEDRPLHVDELLDERAVALLDDHCAGDAELAVEPRVPQPAAVALDAELQVPVRRPLRARLQLEHRRVGVRAHHRDPARARRKLGADGEADERRAVPPVKVLAARLERAAPRLVLRQLGESRLDELPRRLRAAVERRRRAVDERRALGRERVRRRRRVPVGAHGGALESFVEEGAEELSQNIMAGAKFVMAGSAARSDSASCAAATLRRLEAPLPIVRAAEPLLALPTRGFSVPMAWRPWMERTSTRRRQGRAAGAGASAGGADTAAGALQPEGSRAPAKKAATSPRRTPAITNAPCRGARVVDDPI